MKYTRAILALTNGLADAFTPSDSTITRLQKAAEVFKTGDVIITSTGYTVNKPPFLDENGYPALEAVISARYTERTLGIPADGVIAESFSRDTIGNLFVGFQMFVLPLQVKRVAIVTSHFHMARVKAIMDLLAGCFPHYPTDVDYIAANDPEYPADVWEMVKEKERASVEKLKTLKHKLQTGTAFTQWFFEEHRAYSFAFNPQPANPVIQQAY